MFDVKACQRKLLEHYQKTAKVPTTAWSSVLQADLEQIYTRLSWVRQEQTTAGSSQKKKEEQTTAGSSSRELNHYTEMFTKKTKSGVKARRILVQGETGIGKTTFVKKLLVDWSNLQEAKMDEERQDVLGKFDLILAVNLKDVSECQTFEEVISCSLLFPKDEEKSVDDLLCYIRANQDKVLLVFDGYDEYRTGTEAEERYGSRSNSPILEIFHGNILRGCTVLVTTRSSRADELRGPADIQAEITGFSMSDRQEFMGKMLSSQSEVDELLTFLWRSGLEELARVPLLSHFFCLLWMEKKETFMELAERKAKLYQAIVKHILLHCDRRHSSSKASKLKESDDEILAEIGKVALAGLLKGDLLFEFGQLPEKVRGEVGVIVGLFQFSEYALSLVPKKKVSFIHKSIQEYLAAWYLSYSCVPKGNLGEIEQHAATFENCLALENVFQFVCGLSDEGAMKILDHLKSVRDSDPTLDLSKTIPDIVTESDVPLFDVTHRHVRFSDLVYDSFREVQSKAELLSRCLDCTGGVVLVTRDTLLSELIPDVRVLNELTRNCDCVFILGEILFDLNGENSIMYKSLEFLDRLQLPVRITERSDVLKVKDLIRKLRLSCFSAILCLRNGQFQFYVTELFLHGDDYAKLFTESTSIDVPSDAASLCSQQSCLKFLNRLCYHNINAHTVEGLGAVIRSCEHLRMIDLVDDEDSMCYLLEQVQNPSKCSVAIDTSFIHPDVSVDRASAGAVQLASLLPRFSNIISLHLVVRDCCAAALDTLVSGITPKTVEKLILNGIRLTPAAAEVLGRSLPEMSFLQELQLHGIDDCILNAEKMEALFGRFNKRLPLCKVTLSSFNEINCLAPFIESLRFFPNLRELYLEELNDEHGLCGLLESWTLIRNLTELRAWGDQQSRVHCCTLETENILTLGGVNLTPAVATTLGRILPEMSSLQTLKLTGVDGSILQTTEMEALFGKLHKPLPLHELDISGYNVGGSLAPLIKSLRFFPNLAIERLEKLNMDVDDQCALLESLKFIPHLTSLTVQSKPPVHGDISTPRLTLTSDSSALRPSKSLNLHEISLTLATVASLGRTLPEMTSLETLELTTLLQDGRILQAEETEALFGGFSKIMPLSDLYVFYGFNVIGSIAPLTNSFRFFPNLVRLCLAGVNMDEHNVCGLLKNLKFIPKLRELTVDDGCVSRAHCRTAETNPVSGFAHEALRKLKLFEIDLTPAVAVALGRLLPEMLSLQNLRLPRLRCYRNVSKSEEVEALFGGFNKRLPLVELSLSVLRERGVPLGFPAKSFRFFPDLEQLYLGGFLLDEYNLCTLLESFKFIPNLKVLSVKGQSQGNTHCSTVEVNAMASVTHKTLENLQLDGISLTPVSAALLGRSLPEMSSLQTLELTGVNGSNFQAEEMVALFGGFNKTLPLHRVTLRNFCFSGCLATLCKSFHTFPSLKSFKLERISLNELDMCILLESLRFIASVRVVSVKSKPRDQGHATWCDRFSSFTLEAHERLNLDGISLTPVAAAALGRSLPEMSSLQVLQLTGVYGSILQAEHMQALFGGFNKSLPLRELTLSGFGVKGCPSPLIKSLQCFTSLKELNLERLAIDEHDQCGLLKSFGFIHNLTKLDVHVTGEKCVDSVHCHVSHARGRVALYGIKLTPAVFAGLGQLLSEMLFLRDLSLRGLDGSILGADEMEALFGGFNKGMPWYRLTFSGFNVRGSFTPLSKSFRFFPRLKELELEMLNMDEHDVRSLLENVHFIPHLQLLNLSGNPLGHAVTSIVPHVINLKKLKYLWIDATGLSEEDLIYVRDTVRQALPGIQVQGAKT